MAGLCTCVGLCTCLIVSAAAAGAACFGMGCRSTDLKYIPEKPEKSTDEK